MTTTYYKGREINETTQGAFLASLDGETKKHFDSVGSIHYAIDQRLEMPLEVEYTLEECASGVLHLTCGAAPYPAYKRAWFGIGIYGVEAIKSSLDKEWAMTFEDEDGDTFTGTWRECLAEIRKQYSPKLKFKKVSK